MSCVTVICHKMQYHTTSGPINSEMNTLNNYIEYITKNDESEFGFTIINQTQNCLKYVEHTFVAAMYNFDEFVVGHYNYLNDLLFEINEEFAWYNDWNLRFIVILNHINI